MSERASGILLHLSSLPSPFGIGDLGPGAEEFVSFLHHAGQTYWQILPINPTEPITHHSPYSSPSAFAGNELLISPELLAADGLLELGKRPSSVLSETSVDFATVWDFKKNILERAFARFELQPTKFSDLKESYSEFVSQNASWLDDYALFTALKDFHQEAVWTSWPKNLRDRQQKALISFSEKHARDVNLVRFKQFVFFRQWSRLRQYCRSQNVRMIGDVPIYVSMDSADVWANPQNYKLKANRQPLKVAGVPPDYFSRKGQRWGNPVYNWDALKDSGYSWWVHRFRHNFQLYDKVRVDHFRGFVQCWEIPAGHQTAKKGQWSDAPAYDFFQKLEECFGRPLPVIAEDLGFITDDVREVIRHFDFPCMKILMFAFNDDDISHHPYLPQSYPTRCVVYTGTHDNNTIVGWFQSEATPKALLNIDRYFGKKVLPATAHWEFIRSALESKAELAIIPLQDYLGLGEEARMNTPATVRGNWLWRCPRGMLSDELKARMAQLTRDSGRAP